MWSADAGKPHNPPSELLWKSQASWGTGSTIVTSLIDSSGEVRVGMCEGGFSGVKSSFLMSIFLQEVARRCATRTQVEMENGEEEDSESTVTQRVNIFFSLLMRSPPPTPQTPGSWSLSPLFCRAGSPPESAASCEAPAAPPPGAAPAAPRSCVVANALVSLGTMDLSMWQRAPPVGLQRN